MIRTEIPKNNKELIEARRPYVLEGQFSLIWDSDIERLTFYGTGDSHEGKRVYTRPSRGVHIPDFPHAVVEDIALKVDDDYHVVWDSKEHRPWQTKAEGYEFLTHRLGYEHASGDLKIRFWPNFGPVVKEISKRFEEMGLEHQIYRENASIKSRIPGDGMIDPELSSLELSVNYK